MFLGFRGLFEKEVMRFWRVVYQTVFTPVLTTLLYLFIFTHVLGERVRVYEGVTYSVFLAPGLVMMAVLQNAFANSSSSLIQSKVTGNLTLLLLPPISPVTFFAAYAAASVVRGVAVGVGVLAAALVFSGGLGVDAPLWVLAFAVCGGVMMGALGVVAGIWADRFDQIALFTNFIVMPLTFLSGVFYSVHSLPDAWSALTRFNPFFYMIDGFRYGFFSDSDVNPYLSLAVAVAMALLVSAWAVVLLVRGYKIRA